MSTPEEIEFSKTPAETRNVAEVMGEAREVSRSIDRKRQVVGWADSPGPLTARAVVDIPPKMIHQRSLISIDLEGKVDDLSDAGYIWWNEDQRVRETHRRSMKSHRVSQ